MELLTIVFGLVIRIAIIAFWVWMIAKFLLGGWYGAKIEIGKPDGNFHSITEVKPIKRFFKS